MGGNTALALLLTLGTNLAGIFTLPFILTWLVGPTMSTTRLAPAPLLQALVETILVPLLVGAAARAFIPGEWPSCRFSACTITPAQTVLTDYVEANDAAEIAGL